MEKKTVTITIACLLIAFAGGIALIQSSDKTEDQTKDQTSNLEKTQDKPDGKENPSDATPNTEQEGEPAPVARNERTTDADPDLVARYGESRVKLARHIAERIIHLNDLVAEIAALGNTTSATGNGNVRVMTLGGGDTSNLSIEDLSNPEKLRELASDQNSEQAQAMRESSEKAMEDMRKAQESLKEDSRPLQEMLLAGDAVTRGDLSREEYDQLAKDNNAAQTPLITGGLGGMQDGTGLNEPKSLEDTEKQVEKQTKTMESVHSLIDSMEP